MFVTQEMVNQVLDQEFLLGVDFDYRLEEGAFNDALIKAINDHEHLMFDVLNSSFDAQYLASCAYAQVIADLLRACFPEWTEGGFYNFMRPWAEEHGGFKAIAQKTINYINNKRAEAQKEEESTMKSINTTIDTTAANNSNYDIVCPITGVVLIKADGEKVSSYTEIRGVKYLDDIVDDYFTICSECGDYVPNDEIVEIDGEYYCQDCVDREFVTCENCGDYVRRDEAIIADGDYYCESCADDCLRWCKHCAEYHVEDNMSYVESVDRWVCDDCLARHYTRCECCDEYFPDGDTVTVITNERGWTEEWCTSCCEDNTWVCDGCGETFSYSVEYQEEGWDRYCPDCLGDCAQDTGDINTWRSPRRREGYSFKPAPCLCATESERSAAGSDWWKNIVFYGFELEIDRNEKSYKEDEWSGKIVDELPSTYCKKDCSLDKGGDYSGIEIVSHPATLAWYEARKDSFASCFDMLKDGGWLSHDAGTCGLHVHISLHALEAANPYAVNNMLFLVDRFWDKLVKFSRRTEYQLNRWARRYSTARGTYEEIKNMAKRDCDRYMAVNLQNTHTVEIRMFRGTLNPETFFATLQLIDTMVKRCIEIGNDVRRLQSMPWEEFVASDHAELNSYLRRRGLVEGSVETPEPKESNVPEPLTASDFHVGDRVRVISVPDGNTSAVGHEGIVRAIDPSSALAIGVDFDIDEGSNDGIRNLLDIWANGACYNRGWWCPTNTLEIIGRDDSQPERRDGFTVGDHVTVDLMHNACRDVPQHLCHGTVRGFDHLNNIAVEFDCPRTLVNDHGVYLHDCAGLCSGEFGRWCMPNELTLD